MSDIKITRKTKETDITICLLSNDMPSKISTGIGFLDHMLECFSVHAQCPMSVEVKGDVYVDPHHTIEDVGIVLGQCLKKYTAEHSPITRYGDMTLPMDDVLMLCAIDISGRSYLGYDVNFTKEFLGQLDTECIEEFFLSVTRTLQCNLHFKQLSGKNNHHLAESMFKSFAHAFRKATIKRQDKKVLSSKGGLYDSHS